MERLCALFVLNLFGHPQFVRLVFGDKFDRGSAKPDSSVRMFLKRMCLKYPKKYDFVQKTVRNSYGTFILTFIKDQSVGFCISFSYWYGFC